MTSIRWNVPGSGPVLSGWRLSTVTHHQSGAPYSIRYAGDPVATAGVGRGLQLARLPAEHARRGATRRAACSSTTPTSRWRGSSGRATRSRFRADVFNVFNNQNLLAGGYINLVGNPRFGQHTGGGNVFPGPAVPVRGDVSVLLKGRTAPRDDGTPVLVPTLP